MVLKELRRSHGYNMLIILLLLCDVISARNSKEELPMYEGHAAVDGGDFFALVTTSQEGADGEDGEGYIRVDSELQNQTRFEGETIKLDCEITGSPKPYYKWFKDDIEVKGDLGRHLKVRELLWGSRLRILDVTLADSGVYKCVARYDQRRKETAMSLQVVKGNPEVQSPEREKKKHKTSKGKGGGKGREQERNFGGSDRSPSFPSDEFAVSHDGFCQPYRGAACSKFVGNKMIYVKNKLQQGLMEERLTAALTTVAASSELTQRCGEYAIPGLCYFAFPQCSEGRRARPRQMCRQDCEHLQNVLCAEERRSSFARQLFGQSFIPPCHTLPEPGSPAAADCISLGIPGLRNPANDQCYNGSGKTYRGNVAVTRSGQACAYWGLQQYYLQSEYPELGDHNYCRNPGGTEKGPWCFTSLQQKELCSVAPCLTSVRQQKKSLNEMLFILVPSVMVPVALALVLTVVCLCRKNKQYSSHKPLPSAAQLELASVMKSPLPRVRELPFCSLRFLLDLGEGAFGKCYKGELLGYQGDGNGGVCEVVIKTLKEHPSAKQQADFRREVDLLADLKHPNIVCLLGVCMVNEPWCMVFEYMRLGDLRDYLRHRAPNSESSASGNEEEEDHDELEEIHLMSIITQISSGMEYLASHHYVHRDLAARNVLVGDNYTVKISDFGLSRDVYSSDYYRVQSQSLLPVRWMPPEAILYGKFTVESDVWAFGVVLWEVFSFGLQPYYGYNNQEVIEMVRARQILPCPEDCPARIYSLMVECWHEIPTHRPAFKDIHAKLRSWKAELVMGRRYVYNPATYAHSMASHRSASHSESQHSHHSSTGPSNNTGSTGLSAQQQQQHPLHQPPPPQYRPLPTPSTAMRVLPPTAPLSVYTQPPPRAQKRPSTPGSIGSHQSSMLSSPASTHQRNHVMNGGVANGHLPGPGATSTPMNGFIPRGLALPPVTYNHVVSLGSNGLSGRPSYHQSPVLDSSSSSTIQGKISEPVITSCLPNTSALYMPDGRGAEL